VLEQKPGHRYPNIPLHVPGLIGLGKTAFKCHSMIDRAALSSAPTNFTTSLNLPLRDVTFPVTL
jgi:hypothetical protein